MNKMTDLYNYIELKKRMAPANVMEVVLDDKEIPIRVSILDLSSKATFIAKRYIRNYTTHNWKLRQDKKERKEYKTNRKKAKKEGKRLAGMETKRINDLVNKYIKGYITDEEINCANSIKTFYIEQAKAAGKSESDIRAELKSAYKVLCQAKCSKERYCRNAIFLLYHLYYDEVRKHKLIIKSMKDNNRTNILDYYREHRNCRQTMKNLEKIKITQRRGNIDITLIGRNNKDCYSLPIPHKSDSSCRYLYFNEQVEDGEHQYIVGDESFEKWKHLVEIYLHDCLEDEIKGTLKGKNNFQMRLYKRLDAFYRYLIDCEDFKLNKKADIAEFLCALFELDEDEAEKMLVYLGQTKPQKAEFTITSIDSM